jgi:branched-chain amino acid transport system permease protein
MIRRLCPAVLLALVTVCIFAAAPAISQGNLNLGVTLLCYLAIAQAWNVLGGYSGQVSLGAAAFVSTGAYTTALLLIHTGIAWPLALAGAGASAALLAALLAVPLLRLHGDYFAVGTLAISIAIQALLSNWQWAGGASGLTLPIGAVPSGAKLFQIAVLIAGIGMAVTLYVRQSGFGLRLAAIRDNEPAAAGLGVWVMGHRLAVLLISSAITGLAGAVISFQFLVVSPDQVASLSWSLNALLMSIVGGAGTVMGPVLGVFIVYYGLTYALQDQQTLSQVLEGILLVVIVRFAPQGAWPLLCAGLRRLLRLSRRPGTGPGVPAAVDAAAPAEVESVDLV